MAIMPAAFFSSCETVGQAARAAGDAGLIGKEAASAVSDMSAAIGKAQEEITPSEEYYIGRAVSANILANYKLYNADPQLTAYINDILNTLVINSPRPDIYNGYHAAILDTDEINGFSTSGGHIFLTRGLINCAENEDALASVIAHELAHIQLQHSVKSIKNSRFVGALQQVAGTAAKTMGLDELTSVFDDSVKEAVNTMVNSGYSRDQEYEADATALALLAAAGYTPSKIVDMLTVLRQHSQGQTRGFAKTHPTADARITEVNKQLPKYALMDNSAIRQPRFAIFKKFF
jgi:predicted Zn-dependent protease